MRPRALADLARGRPGDLRAPQVLRSGTWHGRDVLFTVAAGRGRPPAGRSCRWRRPGRSSGSAPGRTCHCGPSSVFAASSAASTNWAWRPGAAAGWRTGCADGSGRPAAPARRGARRLDAVEHGLDRRACSRSGTGSGSRRTCRRGTTSCTSRRPGCRADDPAPGERAAAARSCPDSSRAAASTPRGRHGCCALYLLVVGRRYAADLAREHVVLGRGAAGLGARGCCGRGRPVARVERGATA